MNDDQQYAAIDTAILRMIDLVREEHGACTAGQVANRIGVSRDVVIYRCQQMRDDGLVLWSDLHGSLRRVVQGEQRLYDLLIQSAVEKAALGDDELIDEEVLRWAMTVVERARAEAWPELPVEPVGVVDEVPEPTSPATPPSTDDELWCEPCERRMPHNGAMFGHRRSKAHIAATASA